MPVVANVDLRFNVLVTRHLLWEEGRKEEVCGRCGARKIQSVITWLGTGQVVKYAGQFVKYECLKVKFEWLKGAFKGEMGILPLMVRLLIDTYRTAEHQPGRLRGEVTS